MAEQQNSLRNFFGESKKSDKTKKKTSKSRANSCDHEAVKNSCEEGCCTNCNTCGVEVFS